MDPGLVLAVLLGAGAALGALLPRGDAGYRPEGAWRVDPNTADAATLSVLPGIGPVTARAITVERARHGAFAGPADLERVPGIGPATREAMGPLLTFERGGGSGDSPAPRAPVSRRATD